MKHIKFPSIDQFKTIIKKVRDRSHYHGVPVPSFSFSGCVKIHGTNSAIVQDRDTGEIYSQSRDRIVVLGNDNYGFAQFVDKNLEFFKPMFATLERELKNTYLAHLQDHIKQFAIYGEWCGQGICSGVAISSLPKRFVVFKIAAVLDTETVDGKPRWEWFTPEQIAKVVSGPHESVFHIYQFPTYNVTVDFERPELSQSTLVDLTNAVELECPVGKHFGATGNLVGEGIVWTCTSSHDTIETQDLIFKVKGSKHSDSNVTTLAPVDVEKANSVFEFVKSVATDHRLEKMIEKLKEAGHKLEPQSIPHFLKFVSEDVIKEESDTISESGLEMKVTMGALSREARQWFLKHIAIPR